MNGTTGKVIYFPGAAFSAAAICEVGALLLFARAMRRG